MILILPEVQKRSSFSLNEGVHSCNYPYRRWRGRNPTAHLPQQTILPGMPEKLVTKRRIASAPHKPATTRKPVVSKGIEGSTRVPDEYALSVNCEAATNAVATAAPFAALTTPERSSSGTCVFRPTKFVWEVA